MTNLRLVSRVVWGILRGGGVGYLVCVEKKEKKNAAFLQRELLLSSPLLSRIKWGDEAEA